MAKEISELNKQIGERLQRARENLGCTQETFAELLDVAAVHYQRLERGEYALTLDKMVILHEKYGVDLNYLITGKRDSIKAFDFNAYIANCTWDDKNALMADFSKYLWKIVTQYKP